MTQREKIDVAKRALNEIAMACDTISRLSVVDKAERRSWESLIAIARNALKVLEKS